MAAHEEELVEVWIAGQADAVQKGSPLEEEDPGFEGNFDNSPEQGYGGYGGFSSAVLFYHLLWLLFLMGFLFPLIWMVVAVTWGFTCRCVYSHASAAQQLMPTCAWHTIHADSCSTF
jgi:hypothetical protein